MFSKEKDKNQTAQNSSATLISSGTVFHGDVHSDNDLRIDGTIRGNVTSTSKIVIGPSGFIEGNIDGKLADISGKVIGNITVAEAIQLRPKSEVQGDISAATLQAETGAVFNGHCQMGVRASVVMMKDSADAVAKAQ